MPGAIYDLYVQAENALDFPCVPMFAKDGDQLKRALKQLPLGEIQRRWTIFLDLASEKEWESSHVSIAFFVSNINNYAKRFKKPVQRTVQPGSPASDEAERAAEKKKKIQEWLAAMPQKKYEALREQAIDEYVTLTRMPREKAAPMFADDDWSTHEWMHKSARGDIRRMIARTPPGL